MMKQIVQGEVARRKPLFNAAKTLFSPVMSVIELAIAEGAEVSLTLDPPNRRDSSSVIGILRCRSFHAGVGRRLRRYLIEISPIEQSCEVWLPYKMSDEESYYYEKDHGEPPGRDYLWACTYRLNGHPSLSDLKEEIEEAIITQLAERQGGLDRVKLSSK